MKTTIRCLATLIALSIATACGGGGSGAPGASTTVLTSGNVVSLNGQSAQVAGVQIDVPAAGASATSDATGAFDLGALPAAVLDFVITAPDATPLTTGVSLPRMIAVDLSGAQQARLHLKVSDDGEPEVSTERCSGGGSDSETRVAMQPVEIGLAGRIRVRRRDDGHTGFDVEVEHLAPGRTVEVFVIDPASAVSESQGVVPADGLGEAELELRTNDGARLPFGVLDVDDLEGYAVEVRAPTGGALLLSGAVPATGGATQCTSGGGNGDRETGESVLINAAGVSGLARVELRSRPERGEERIEVEVTGTSVAGAIAVWLEDPAVPGAMTLVGMLSPEGLALEFERDTEQGETLPFGVTQASDLTGLRIELRRQADGAVVYQGTTPPLNPS